MKILPWVFCLYLILVFNQKSSAQTGCIDNSNGGNFIYTAILFGSTYNLNGAKVAHSYSPAGQCYAVIDNASSTYASCTITNGITTNSGSVVTYYFVNCPLDDYAWLLLVFLGGFCYWKISIKSIVIT